MKPKIVTVDGPAGSGKSTVSRMLAERLNYIYLDTGAMYRAVALEAGRKGIEPEDAASLKTLCEGLDLNFSADGKENRICIGREDVSSAIRSPEMDMLSSRVSAVREVREAMTVLQRKIGEGGSLVAEGRDMGTVVFPNADHKFFITASTDVRARRRYLERRQKGEDVSLEQVHRDLVRRDEQDSGREIAPLQPAEDAKTIDTTTISPEKVVERMMQEIGPE